MGNGGIKRGVFDLQFPPQLFCHGADNVNIHADHFPAHPELIRRESRFRHHDQLVRGLRILSAGGQEHGGPDQREYDEQSGKAAPTPFDCGITRYHTHLRVLPPAFQKFSHTL